MLFNTIRDLFVPELSSPICGWDGSVQGVMYLPNPMQSMNKQTKGQPWMPVGGTLTVGSNMPSWTIDALTKKINLRDTDVWSGFIGGSAAFQMWLDWTQYHYAIPKMNCNPGDLDWHFVPLWVPHEYPLGQFPIQDRIPIFDIIPGTEQDTRKPWIQPMVEKLAYEWTQNWWARPGFIDHFRYQLRNEPLLRGNNDVIPRYQYEGILTNIVGRSGPFWKRPGNVSPCPEIQEVWTYGGNRQSLRQYYFFLQGNNQNGEVSGEIDIHWTRPITLKTAQLLQPGSNPSHSLWVNVYSPQGLVMPLQTPARLVRGYVNQLENSFHGAKNAGQFHRLKKAQKSLERLRMFFRWRESLLPFSQPGDWIEQTLMQRDDLLYWSEITKRTLYHMDLPTDPTRAMQVSSSYMNEWSEMEHPLTNHSI